jgi:CBS domain-containing protein
MLVQDVLKAKQRDLITVEPKHSVRAAMELLLDNRISCLPVVDDKQELCGIISDKDIFRKVHADPKGFGETLVSDLMTTDVIVGLPKDEIGYIAGIMTQNRIRHVPVVDGRKLIGLISVGDVVKTQMENIQIENRYLKQFIDGSYPG